MHLLKCGISVVKGQRRYLQRPRARAKRVRVDVPPQEGPLAGTGERRQIRLWDRTMTACCDERAVHLDDVERARNPE